MNEKARRAREEAERLIEKAQLPAVRALHARRVREEFWPKLRRVIGRIPFAGDLVAAYYAARDPKTPVAAKATLTAALFYFVLPTDVLPDFIIGLGFVDDGAVLATLIALSAAHVKDRHRALARQVLGHSEPANDLGSEASPA
jgi:uncharacterized membrane protein YkvA (DUF1232 family)